jgi:dTDP-4-amino-4,6-dideoxygalactose transaminase
MKNKVIPLFKVYMSERAPQAVAEVLQSGFIGEGPKVKEFENLLQKYFDKTSDNLTLLNSATSAEHLLYHYLKKDRLLYNNEYGYVAFSTTEWEGLKPTDEVLTTSLTCTATNWPIILNGLNLRWVDVDPITLNMSLNDLETKINENTRIVTLVHWGGTPVDLDKLRSIVSRAEAKYGRKIIVIEDCAHAFGSKYKGKYVGFTGNFATFSLQAIKHITSIDGGFISSPYSSFTQESKLLRWYGIDRNGPRADFRCEADVPEAGFKFHMNDVSAAVGIENLLDSDKILPVNKDNAKYYNEELKNIAGITTITQVEGGESAYWLYSLHVDKRDDFMRYMGENGVYTSRVHERNDKHTCVKQYQTDLPGVDKAVSTMINLPVGYWVTKEDREYITDLIKKGW